MPLFRLTPVQEDESEAIAFDPYALEEPEESMMDIRSIDDREVEEGSVATGTWSRVIMATVAVGAFVGVASTTGCGEGNGAAAGDEFTIARLQLLRKS